MQSWIGDMYGPSNNCKKNKKESAKGPTKGFFEFSFGLRAF
jgi:hypothetical protein